MQQTVLPDEIVIVDGGSADGTWEKLQTLARTSAVPVQLKQQRCNIAAGRNQAIELTTADIIAASDAGSFPAPDWFAEITRPLLNDTGLDVVGGCSVPKIENEFQKLIQLLDGPEPAPRTGTEVYPSSRNVAFRRQAWADVGGYPEWLTLTAEDALFNFELHQLGKIFSYNAAAIVHWPVRENAAAYFRMLYHYGYGSAEARLHARYFWRRTALMLFPPALLLSKHRFKHFGFRYRKNAASARGWLMGWLKGRTAPANWQRINGILLSPEAQRQRPQTVTCAGAEK